MNFSKIEFGLTTVICAIVAIILTTLIILLIIPFAAYKCLLNLFLSLWHNKNYGGMLSPRDMVFCSNIKSSRYIINFALFLENDGAEGDFVDFVRNVIFPRMCHNKRFTAVRQSCSGYWYWVENQLKLEEVVGVVKVAEETRCDREWLNNFFQSQTNVPLPRENRAAWKVLVVDKPVEFEMVKKKNVHVLLFKIHHTVGDGVTLTSILIRTLCDGSAKLNKERTEILPKKEPEKGWLVKFKGDVSKLAQWLRKTEINMVLNENIYANDMFHGRKGCGEKVLAFFLENETSYVGKVKRIKRVVPNCSFSDVFFAGLSYALEKNFITVS